LVFAINYIYLQTRIPLWPSAGTVGSLVNRPIGWAVFQQTIIWMALVACVSPLALRSASWRTNSYVAGLPIRVGSDVWVSCFSTTLLVVSRRIIRWRIYYMGPNSETTILHLNIIWFVCSIILLLYAGRVVVGLVG